MTLAGWILMLATVFAITTLLIWCVHKVVATPGSETHLHSQADIHPPDKEK
jgi:hypothetical protein